MSDTHPANVDLANQAALLDADDLLSEFGWNASKGATALEQKLLQELMALEKTTVRSIIDADTPVKSILGELDNANNHLDAIHSWLRGYDYELDSMEQDILEIQSQNELLKVEEKNQSRLLEELEYLLYSITISDDELGILREETLESAQGLHKIEVAAGRLQRMLQSDLDPQLQAMRATQEKLESYKYFASSFSARVSEYLKVMFQFNIESILNDKSRVRGKLAPAPGVIVKPIGPLSVHESLLKYRALTLWLKQMETAKYKELRMIYVQSMSNLYSAQIKDLVDSVRPLMFKAKSTNEDAEHLFTSYNVPNKTVPMQLAQSAVKPRRNSFNTPQMANQDIQTRPDEVFHLAMTCVIPLAIGEQNFIDDTFNIHPTVPFYEYISRSDFRTLDNLTVPRPREKDSQIAKELKDLMGLTFSVLGSEIPSLIELGLRNDKIHSVGMMVSVEQHMKECEISNQEFLFVVLQNMQKQLAATFARFVDEQLRAIDETKVTTKKRIGILPFFRVFPRFAKKLDGILGNSQTEARKLVSQGYEKIVRTMFARLLAIARDADVASYQTDDKDAVKEQLNAHILTLENMHYFYSALRATEVSVLKPYIEQALTNYNMAMSAYVKTVIRRPLGKLIEFFEGIESLLKTGDASEVGYHLSYNKAALKKVLVQYQGEELRRNIKALHKRVEKHFSDSGPIKSLVWKEIYLELVHQHDRFNALIARCFPQDKLSVGFSIMDLQTWCDS
ncbi:hypothetical protein H4R33_005256 [Dimargaris cristalligena]|uniref:Exocyst complex component Sec3-domain-containing protein n=1 Tax=Dimargaris cristalligena TaxID=215637 RepID=A0A4P9ZSJ4_9FUNG|nr:hypothetical protein H4R33_005256 [Dimargaris cristalligena]RKP36375.1 exocyst complex component Sec3-domain-containing protein [Dimargaris cristalligena]|eukprot:RKP36375.1 exocyst complex component Sec3-domain-containing protein [Dimargaris cristalligena]